MRKLKSILSVLLTIFLTLGMMAGCGSSDNGGNDGNVTSNDSSEPQYGGHLNVHVYNAMTGLDPLKQTGLWKYPWTTCVYENPLTRDAENNIAPGVCNYELSDDKLILKLWVRDGASFSDGSAVDIEDVVASINRSLSLYKNIKTYVAPYISKIDVDGDTATITFSEYHEKIWYYMAAWQTWMAVLPQEICEKYADDYITDQMEDAIGTGPYKFSDFEDSVQVTVIKNNNYVPVEAGRTGFAGPKMGYLDSITFWSNEDSNSAMMAVLSGDYDITDEISDAYLETVYDAGLIREELPSTSDATFIFNTMGTNLCAKYPSLRKAVMAAIDFDEYMDVVIGEAFRAEGTPVLGSIYDTDVFTSADYYGADNIEVCNKYLEQAEQEGYNGEPIQLYVDSSSTDTATMLSSYLDNAGINFELHTLELSAYDEYVGNTSNNWDFRFYWSTRSFTPTQMPNAFILNCYNNPEKDKLLAEMDLLDPESDEYIAKWNELAQMMVDDCSSVYIGYIQWFWYHLPTLHTNDEGYNRYFFNSYWEDPENHQ